MTDTIAETNKSAATGPPRSIHEPTSTGRAGEATPRQAIAALRGAARPVLAGFLVAGVAASVMGVLAVPASAALSPAQKLVGQIAALGRLALYGALGWVVSALLQAAAAALELLGRRVEAAESTESLAARAVEQLTELLDRAPAPAPPAAAPVAAPAPAAAAPADPLQEIRTAIGEGRWSEADALLREFLDEHPGDPRGERLADELGEARATAARSLRAQLDAARAVNDPARVLELREALLILIEHEGRLAFDQELVRWFMGLIQKRLRAGKIRTDVAELAARVAETFDHTAEGASLRAALPTLRRSAGLCARCGQPYTGIADACPKCLATASFPAYGADPSAETGEEDLSEVSADSDDDLLPPSRSDPEPGLNLDGDGEL
jgi:hypothetical protein